MELTSALSEIFTGSSYRESICPTGAKIGSSYRKKYRGCGKSEVKLQSLSEANSIETRLGSRYREVREIGIPLYSCPAPQKNLVLKVFS